MAFAFTLPELGENIDTGDVVTVLVAVGDTVSIDQPVVELETDKATVEVPSPAAGVVTEVAVQAGDTIAVGQLILSIETEAPEADRAPAPDPEVVDDPPPTETAPEARIETAPETPPDPSPETPEPAAAVPSPSPVSGGRVLAAPSTRRLAREFGVDLTEVKGSGARGRVTAEDVKAHARQSMQQLRQGAAGTPATSSSAVELPDFSRWGTVERTPMRGIRRATSRQMTRAWTAPHVTQHDRADIGQFETARQRLKKASSPVPLTVTAYAVKVLAAALKVFPQFNASLDVGREEIVYKRYINIGIAVDTDGGLVVPVIKGADQKTLAQISVEVAELAAKARNKTVTIDDLQGGTFTVTNLGGLGGTSFTPIINHPEVAILGMSRSTHEPVLVDGAFHPRLMLPLSLSYDHRLIDGADAVRFLRWVVERLEHPLLLDLE